MRELFKRYFRNFQTLQQQSVGSPKAGPQRFCTWAGASRPQGLQAEGHPWKRRLWKGRVDLGSPGIEEKDSTSLGFLGRKDHNWRCLCYQGDRKRGNKYTVVSTSIVGDNWKRRHCHHYAWKRCFGPGGWKRPMQVISKIRDFPLFDA